jgi:hypothetical protein
MDCRRPRSISQHKTLSGTHRGSGSSCNIESKQDLPIVGARVLLNHEHRTSPRAHDLLNDRALQGINNAAPLVRAHDYQISGLTRDRVQNHSLKIARTHGYIGRRFCVPQRRAHTRFHASNGDLQRLRQHPFRCHWRHHVQQ